MSLYIIIITVLLILLVVAAGAAMHYRDWAILEVEEARAWLTCGECERNRSRQTENDYDQRIKRLLLMLDSECTSRKQLIETNANLVASIELLHDEIELNNAAWARELLKADVIEEPLDLSNVDVPIPFILNEDTSKVVTMFPPDPNAPDPLFGD